MNPIANASENFNSNAVRETFQNRRKKQSRVWFF